jgi:hypothetical protein
MDLFFDEVSQKNINLNIVEQSTIYEVVDKIKVKTTK